MNRFCPNCNQQLYLDTSYFCPNCGFALQEELVARAEEFKIKQTKFEFQEQKQFTLNFPVLKKIVSMLFSLAFVLVILIGLNYYLGYSAADSAIKIAKPVAQEKKTELNTVDLNLGAAELTFGDNLSHAYVPVDVDFYIETSGLGYWLDIFLGESKQENYLFSLVDRVNPEFSVYGVRANDSWVVGLILFPKDISQMLEFSENIKVENWTVEVVEEALVITNDSTQIAKIRSSALQISKNVSHNQKYSSSKSLLSKSGQLMYLSLSDKSPELVFDLAREFSSSPELSDIINEVKQKGYDKFVIKNIHGSN